MDRKIGPYLYFDGWMRRRRFSADGTSARTFVVVIASAYDAGIIGPEHNGIAILDEDKLAVLLDQHLCESSGYSGPSKRQKAEFHRIMAMNWAEFSEFSRTNKRFRKGVADDIENGTEAEYVEEDGLREAIRTGRATETGTDIRTAEMKKLDDPAVEAGGLKFSCRTREQMIVHLARHHTHLIHHHGPFAIAWDIKVHDFDRSGRAAGGETTDPKFDLRWEDHLNKNGDEVFAGACEDALRPYLEELYMTYPGDDQGAYKFGLVGRQGGHLTLQSWDGPQPRAGNYPMAFDGQSELIDYLRELAPADLCRLYKLVANVDHDVSNREAEMAMHYNSRRASLEQEWTAEFENENSPSP